MQSPNTIAYFCIRRSEKVIIAQAAPAISLGAAIQVEQLTVLTQLLVCQAQIIEIDSDLLKIIYSNINLFDK